LNQIHHFPTRSNESFVFHQLLVLNHLPDLFMMSMHMISMGRENNENNVSLLTFERIMECFNFHSRELFTLIFSRSKIFGEVRKDKYALSHHIMKRKLRLMHDMKMRFVVSGVHLTPLLSLAVSPVRSIYYAENHCV
jgi:hypothetical protein